VPVEGKTGFVGLGRMGTAMAANLAAAGRQVIAYIRHQNRMDELASLGLEPTTDITDLFDCEIVVSMLPDDDTVLDASFGRPDWYRRARHGIEARRCSPFDEHDRHGQGYVAAPVFGNPDAAKARELFIVAAGAPADVERCQPLLDVLGQRTFIVGAEPAHANLIKLLGNMMTATTLEMLGETVALVRKRDLDPNVFIEILTTTMFGGRAHRIHDGKIVAQSYAAGFALPLALKDVRLTLAEAEAAKVPIPSVGVVRNRLLTGIARGYADPGWTALGLIAAKEADISAELSVKR